MAENTHIYIPVFSWKTKQKSNSLKYYIKRGRDHGLPGFCCYYALYQDPKIDCSDLDWSKRYEGISPFNWDQLQSIYEKPGDIDLFTGGLAQDVVDGCLTGKVFNNIIGIFLCST